LTTIAYRDGIFAGDSQMTEGHVKTICGPKITVINPTLVLALAGDVSTEWSVYKFFRDPAWKENLDNDKVPKIKGKMEAILWSEGQLYFLQGSIYPVLVAHPFYAIGSGWGFALSGMELGLSAADAVIHASKYDIYTNDRIQVVNVKDLQKTTTKKQGRRAGNTPVASTEKGTE
jgi:ATP-dependent protease HslVU (ClpYQ) peptidase subunit